MNGLEGGRDDELTTLVPSSLYINSVFGAKLAISAFQSILRKLTSCVQVPHKINSSFLSIAAW